MNASPSRPAPEKFRVGLTFDLLRSTYMEWQEDKAVRLSAALAYYTIFSIAPLIVVAIAIAASALGQEAATDQIRKQLEGNLTPQAAQTVQDMIEATSKARGTGITATAISILVSLWGASNLFGQLQDSLNTIWEVTPKPSEGIWNMVRQRFVAFVMVLGLGFLLLVSLIALTVASAASAFVSRELGIPEVSLNVINVGVMLVATTLFFAMLYKLLPDADVQWRDVWVGAFLTAVLFGILRFALTWYLGRSSVSSAYGAAGSLIVLLLWIYYAAQTLFFGAEFTQVFANRFGSRVRPSSHAIPVTESMREQEGMPRLGDLQASEVALDAARRGRPIRHASVPLKDARKHASDSPQPEAKTPLQVLARVTGAKPGQQRIGKADRDYLVGAALGFAAILAIAIRRDRSE